TPLVSKFIVTFDRPIDPASFTPSAVTVVYRNPNTPGTTPGTLIPVTSVTVVPNTVVPNTQFLVSFAPQSGVGTYSYTVGPMIRDRVRTPTQPGNFMDQNADGVAGELPDAKTGAQGDTYAVPVPLPGFQSYTPAAGGFFRAGFDPATQPLIVPGPHLSGSHVPNNPVTSDNLVLNGTVSGIDVTFDRDMDPSTFDASKIVRMVG